MSSKSQTKGASTTKNSEVLKINENKLLASMSRLRKENYFSTNLASVQKNKRSGRPMKRRTINRKGLPRIWYGKDGLREKGITTLMLREDDVSGGAFLQNLVFTDEVNIHSVISCDLA